MFNEHLTPSIIIRWSRFQVNHGLRSDCCFSLNSARSHPPAYNNLKILLFFTAVYAKNAVVGCQFNAGNYVWSCLLHCLKTSWSFVWSGLNLFEY